MYVLFWLVGGTFVLIGTIRDIQRHRTNTVSIFPWWAWFNVTRENNPPLYWTCIAAQFLIVAACIFFAFWKPNGN